MPIYLSCFETKLYIGGKEPWCSLRIVLNPRVPSFEQGCGVCLGTGGEVEKRFMGNVVDVSYKAVVSCFKP